MGTPLIFFYHRKAVKSGTWDCTACLHLHLLVAHLSFLEIFKKEGFNNESFFGVGMSFVAHFTQTQVHHEMSCKTFFALFPHFIFCTPPPTVASCNMRCVQNICNFTFRYQKEIMPPILFLGRSKRSFLLTINVLTNRFVVESACDWTKAEYLKELQILS